jgi:hypothetical protein
MALALASSRVGAVTSSKGWGLWAVSSIMRGVRAHAAALCAFSVELQSLR